MLAAGMEVVGEGRGIGCLPLCRHTERRTSGAEHRSPERRTTLLPSCLPMGDTLGTPMLFGTRANHAKRKGAR